MLFWRGRNACGFSDCIVVGAVLVLDAEPLREFPARLQFVEFRGTYPRLRVGYGVVHDDLHFQCVVIQSPVALRQVHLFAARIPKAIHPHLVVKTNGVDNEGISLPLAHRVPQPSGIRILGKRSPVRPDRAPGVILLEEHKHSAGNLNDLKWIGKNKKSWRTIRLTAQSWVAFLAWNGPRTRYGFRGIELRLSPSRQGRTHLFIDGIHSREPWPSARGILHPHSRQIVREGERHSLIFFRFGWLAGLSQHHLRKGQHCSNRTSEST